MNRLQGVRLSYKHLWRDNRDKQFRDQGAFSIIESFKFRDSRKVGVAGSFVEHSSEFRWSGTLFESFDSGYIKKIDYGLTRSLSPAARRLYRYLDKHFHPPHKLRISLDLARLAYQHIGVSPNVALDKVRNRHIGPASEELQELGYLKEPKSGTFEKVRRGIWTASFELSTATRSEANDSRTRNLVADLGRRGISHVDGCKFVASHSKEEIQRAMRAMDEQIHKGVEIRQPNRWFAKALQSGFRASAAVERSALRPELKVFRSSQRR